MKVGILTQPLGQNYGGLLQNYALQNALMSLGVESVTIDQCEKHKTLFGKIKHDLKTMWLYIIGKSNDGTYDLLKTNNKQLQIIRRNTDLFISKYINCTPKIRRVRDFKVYAKRFRFDAYIVGSDQCWRPRYNQFIKEMYLAFLPANDKALKIAYAVSFGTESWEYDEALTKQCRLLAHRFNNISVREQSGIALCAKYLKVSAIKVLDPTMLLPVKEYIKLIQDNDELPPKGNLFYYILDPNIEKQKFVEYVSNSLGLLPFKVMPKYQEECRSSKIVKHHIDECIYPKVTSWLNGIFMSKMAIVDSFHGAVFSIIFNIPFWVISNETRGNARFHSLLNTFGLEDRLIDIKNYKNTDLSKPIDWKMVNKNLVQMRNLSLDYLKNSLKI